MTTPDAPRARALSLAEQTARNRKSKQTRDYNNAQLIPHLREVERIIKRQLTSHEILSPKFKASLKAYMAWAAMWKE